MSADETVSTEHGQIVVVEVRTEAIPKGDDDRLLWSAHLANYIRDEVDYGPKGTEVLLRKQWSDVPDNRLRKAIPVDELRALINGLRQAARPRVEWQDDQIEMARDVIKIMKMDIETLLASFIESNDLHRIMEGDQF
jgi:hypothetical protein